VNKPNGEDFLDPVLRCDSCQTLLKRETLHKIGSCSKCGNKRMRNLTVFDEDERDQMLDWGFDEFVSEYELVDDG